MTYLLKDCVVPPQTMNPGKECINFLSSAVLDCQNLADIPIHKIVYNDPYDDTNGNLPWRASYILDDIYVSYSQGTGDGQYAINGIHMNWCQPVEGSRT